MRWPDYCSKLNELFFHPGKFFDRYGKEKKYKKPLFFYVIIAIVPILLTFIFSLISVISFFSGSELFSNSVMVFASMIFSTAFAFAIPFISSFFVHMGVKIFRGKKDYFETFKAVTYGISVGEIYSAILVFLLAVFSIIFAGSFILDLNSLMFFIENQTFSIGFAFVYGFIGFFSLIHVLISETIGVAKLQKMSKLRAFFAVIIVPLIILVTIFLLILLAFNYYTGNPGIASSAGF